MAVESDHRDLELKPKTKVSLRRKTTGLRFHDDDTADDEPDSITTDNEEYKHERTSISEAEVGEQEGTNGAKVSVSEDPQELSYFDNNYDNEEEEEEEEEEELEEEDEVEEDGFGGSTDARKQAIMYGKMSSAGNNSADDHDEHHRKHIEAVISSVLQTREDYSSFHADNPGFFHIVLDTSDLCDSFKTLENCAESCLINFKANSNGKNLKKTILSHAGINKADERNFVTERIRDFKNSAMLWSKGQDILSTQDHVERKPNYYEDVKPRENIFQKSTCASNLLDPTLPRPKITLKMKRIVELHEKKIRCSRDKNFDC
jgi:hypothetical protein